MRRSKPLAVVLAAAAAGAVWLTNQTDQPDTPAHAAPPADFDVGAARDSLQHLPVRAERSMSGYDRDKFDVWSNQGHGCDTRAELLKRTSETPAQTNAHCTVTSGTWTGARRPTPTIRRRGGTMRSVKLAQTARLSARGYGIVLMLPSSTTPTRPAAPNGSNPLPTPPRT